MYLRTTITGAVLLTIALQSQPQGGENNRLTFEAASVKPRAPGTRGGIIRVMPGNQRYHCENMTLRTIMTVAYTVTDRQISGGPGWLETDGYDIEAKASRPRTDHELNVMLQHLLEDRFQLRLRHEAREEAAYLLTVDKRGSKMPAHDADDKDYPPIGGDVLRATDGSICPGLAGRNVTMNYFAFVLSRMLDLQVIDRTGLPARYDLALHYAPDDGGLRSGLGGVGQTYTPDCDDIRSALPIQLGLRMEKGRGIVEHLVVEHADKPTEN
jgi:uncharacterized protein (TIGR03435 family)